MGESTDSTCCYHSDGFAYVAQTVSKTLCKILCGKNKNKKRMLVFIGFEALHGEVSMYFWFAVTPCVYLLAR